MKEVAVRESIDVKCLIFDCLGSNSIVANMSGTRTSEVRYKAWGEDRYVYGSSPTSYRYTGQRAESSIGLYFYGARWYDASLGRFTSADTIVPNPGDPMAFDRYAYTRNNPIKYTDPSGHGYCNSEYAVLEECQSYLPNRLASLQNHGVFLQPLDSMTPDDYFFDSESHPGQDYPNSEGSPIYAPADGVVILVDNCSAPDCVSEKRGDYDDRTPFNDGYGNVVVIEYPYDVLPSQVIDEYGLDPGESLFVLYAHLQNPSTLKPGDTVEPGQVIGSVGSTGFSTGPHLHYEVRQGATGSLPYGYMCDTICWYYKPYGNHGAKYSDWYGSGHYAAIDPLTINYIPISDYYYYGTSFTAE